jgi:hypothetical protein
VKMGGSQLQESKAATIMAPHELWILRNFADLETPEVQNVLRSSIHDSENINNLEATSQMSACNKLKWKRVETQSVFPEGGGIH